MRVLITGANGYIGARLIPALAEAGHEVIALVRSPHRLYLPNHLKDEVQVVVGDLLKPEKLKNIPEDIDAAYYLVHSMATTSKGFYALEEQCARNFVVRLKQTQAKQLIYLTGFANDLHLSSHLASRLNVEKILKGSGIPYTILRAGIIIGSGSASFEIIRDLVEKLPFMITPKWVRNRCQLIGIYDVLHYLEGVLGNEKCYDRVFDIGGPEKLTYQEMILRFAKIRGLKRYILDVSVLSPRLSSYWLYFVTSTSFPLAQALVDSLKNEAVCEDESIKEFIPHECMTYEAAIERAFSKIDQNAVISSWKDAIGVSHIKPDLREYIEVPKHGCVNEVVEIPIKGDPEEVLHRIWTIGGNKGWYYMNWAWSLRGFLDKMVGGVGLRRGRTDPKRLIPGDALDFWRVLLADRERGHLLLYAEMKVPGEAWLDLKVEDGVYKQTATFRPKGLLGRLYWYALLPIHLLIFKGMARKIASEDL